MLTCSSASTRFRRSSGRLGGWIGGTAGAAGARPRAAADLGRGALPGLAEEQGGQAQGHQDGQQVARGGFPARHRVVPPTRPGDGQVAPPTFYQQGRRPKASCRVAERTRASAPSEPERTPLVRLRASPCGMKGPAVGPPDRSPRWVPRFVPGEPHSQAPARVRPRTRGSPRPRSAISGRKDRASLRRLDSGRAARHNEPRRAARPGASPPQHSPAPRNRADGSSRPARALG